MTADPRAALATFVAALEAHLELSAVRRGEDDPAVVAAYEKVADAFVAYDDALLTAYGEVTPLDLPDEDDDDDELVDEAELAQLDDEDDWDDEDEDEDGQDGDDDRGDWDDDDYDLDEDDDEESGSYVGLDVEDYDVEDEAGASRR